jgi:hemolysin activation/secretion protein
MGLFPRTGGDSVAPVSRRGLSSRVRLVGPLFCFLVTGLCAQESEATAAVEEPKAETASADIAQAEPSGPAPEAAPAAGQEPAPAAGTSGSTAPEQAPEATPQQTLPPAVESEPASSPEAPASEPARSIDPGAVIDRFEFAYGLEHPELPPLEELQQITVQATRDAGVFRAAAAGSAENLTLSAVQAGSRFDGDVLRGIAQEVVRWYNRRGLNGVWVAYRDLELSATGLVDNRTENDRAARLVVWASQISEVRTLARGKRFRPDNSINNRKHRKILSRSPLHGPGPNGEPGSLFSKDVLDDYLYGLSLHPGRRVEASIAAADKPGKVVLDYLINEARPWQVYAQFNNYGTEGTGVYRGRLGFQHTQLTNHDDILSVDVISTPDLETYGAFLSYRIPLWRPAKVLARIYGSYGDFLANDTSIDPGRGIELRYIGENWVAGVEFSNRLTLWRDWQLLSVAGANFNHYGIQQIINQSPLTAGSSEFLVPFLGTTLSRSFTWGALSGGIRFDHTVGDFANLDATTGIPTLGRRGADPDWTSGRWNVNGTVYLDQLFSRSAETPLAHEVSLRLKGRTLLRGTRLIPHEQEPLGGAMSIRGYPESILSADEFVAATVEYAYHLPRALKPGSEGRLYKWPFNWRPKQAGQNADWDLVFRAYYDYAHRGVSPAPPVAGQPPVADEDLEYIDRSFAISGAGVGVTLLVKQNFSLRIDYAMSLTELRDDEQLPGEEIILPKGNKELYILTSFTW